jgi:pimeloyl-ACP methyl ester carboxylesterase
VPLLYISANEPAARCDIAALAALFPQIAFGRTVGSGHFCQLEVPDQVNAMIDRFVTTSLDPR